MAGAARAAARAPHPTQVPLSRLGAKERRRTQGDQEAAILSSVQGEEEENFIESQMRDDGSQIQPCSRDAPPERGKGSS